MPNMYRVRATINYGAGGPGLGTVYFIIGAGTIAAEIADAVGRVRAFYNAFAAQLANTSAVLVQGAVDVIDPTTGALVVSGATTPPAAVVGTGTAPYLPVPTSIVVQLHTATIVARRRVQGRSFVGPLSSSASNAGLTPTTAVGTAAAAASTALLTGASGIVPCVWHRPGLAAGSGSAAALINATAWSQFGVLRSRRD